jgi:hypothetical protein
MAKLTYADRKKIPASETAVPAERTKTGGAAPGSYPIPDEAHARNALARSSGKPVAAQVRAKVKAKFPGIQIARLKD